MINERTLMIFLMTFSIGKRCGRSYNASFVWRGHEAILPCVGTGTRAQAISSYTSFPIDGSINVVRSAGLSTGVMRGTDCRLPPGQV